VGRAPNDFDQSAFSVVAVIADALERAGSSDRQKLRNALAQTNLNPGSGIVPCMNFDGIKFDSSGKNVRANNLVLMSKGVDNYTVSPAKYADIKPVFPRPAWASL
jgi:branched-chain amino acid transport system substrate-binding protein